MEIREVLEDGVENITETVKKRPFLVAAVAVGAVALYGLYRKSQTADGSNYYDGSQAIGYAGYPTVSSGGSSSSEYDYYQTEVDRITEEYSNSLDDLESQYNSTLVEMEKTYASQMEGLSSTVDSLTSDLDTIRATNEAQSLAITRANDLAQMKANSELYNALSGPEHKATRDALHAENLAIAEKYGLTYNSQTGNYYDNGTVAYTTSKQQVSTYSGKTANTTKSEPVKFEANVDYQAKINEAVKNGASSETVAQLQKQRQAKIDALYGGKDPFTKTAPGANIAK